jgi:cytochrome c oxidase subunit 1
MTETIIAQEDHPHGWRRYVYSTNHKDIGTMYFAFAAFAGAIGILLALAMRAELMFPGLQVFASPHAYNVFVTTHGLIMVFFAALPAMIGGFGNWLVPLMIGAPDVAFPRMNNLSFWLLPFAFALLVLSLFAAGDSGGAGAGVGWTLYPPLSTDGAPGPAMDLVIFALSMATASVLLSAVNFITTILNMRAPGMTLHKLPLFTWSMLVAAFLLLLTLPVLLAALIMLLLDRHFGAILFDAAGGGDPLLYQHLFWFFGQPAIYALILPGVGMIGHVVATFSRKPLFGRLGMTYAMAATGVIGLTGWAKHMFAAGLSVETQAYFVFAAMLVAVPMTFMMFSLIATMWGGSISFRAPMLWAIGFIPVLVIGGMTGVVLANAGINIVLHDTDYEVAQFHYLLALSWLFALFAGLYFWFPKFTGCLYNETLAKLHFWITFVGANLAFIPLFFLGLGGMPSRVADYPDAFAGWNLVASCGAFAVFAGLLVFMAATVEALRRKRRAGANPWGEGATTLEWTLPSPPPFRAFDELPRID